MQVAALRKAGVRRPVEETRSGALDLPARDALLAKLNPGDVLLVYKVDRLARSLRGLLDVADRVGKAGASLRSLTEPIDTGTPIGRAFFQLLGVFAELERALIRERCTAGRLAAAERGVRFGPKPRITEALCRDLVGRGLYLREAARFAGVSKGALGRAMQRYGLRCVVDGRQARFGKDP